MLSTALLAEPQVTIPVRSVADPSENVPEAESRGGVPFESLGVEGVTASETSTGARFATANNTTGTFTPSPTAYNFSLTPCKGHSFKNWMSTGAVHLPTSNKLIISANGTFKVIYS